MNDQSILDFLGLIGTCARAAKTVNVAIQPELPEGTVLCLISTDLEQFITQTLAQKYETSGGPEASPNVESPVSIIPSSDTV